MDTHRRRDPVQSSLPPLICILYNQKLKKAAYFIKLLVDSLRVAPGVGVGVDLASFASDFVQGSWYSVGARIFVITFAFMSLILCSTYTANVRLGLYC